MKKANMRKAFITISLIILALEICGIAIQCKVNLTEKMEIIIIIIGAFMAIPVNCLARIYDMKDSPTIRSKIYWAIAISYPAWGILMAVLIWVDVVTLVRAEVLSSILAIAYLVFVFYDIGTDIRQEKHLSAINSQH